MMTAHVSLFCRLLRVLLVLSCALLAPRYAFAQLIDLPGTQPGELDGAAPLDSARQCGTSCHYSGDLAVPNAMPYDAYSGSMMGNTMYDPLFLAALTIAEQDRPGTGDWCLRCHTPPGFIGGRTRGTPTASLGANLISTDREGVTCDSCHRMLPTPNLGNAQYVLSPTETRFGPYAMIDNIRHPGAASTWLADSRMCGTCHNVANPVQPLRRADGTDTGHRFPLDTTYSEWANSAFAVAGTPDSRTCQDCHLPRIEGPGYVSTNSKAMLRDRPRRHEFAGANAWALRVLATMRTDLAAGEFYDPAAAPFYEAGALRAEASLRGAVSLEFREVPTSADAGARIEVVARMTNRTGHRVPTGYVDGRRIWLSVDLVDASGRATPVSGSYDMAAAHLDETDTQLKIYESVQGRVGMGHGGHLALNDTILRDTRLPPRGYRPLAGHEPVGVDYSGGEGGALRHWDDARYAFAIPATASGMMTIRVRARYQSTTREYVEFLARENRTDDRGDELLRRYEASGRAAPFDMAEITAQIAVSAVALDAGTPDSGAVADSGTDDTGRPADTMADEGAPPRGNCGCHTATRVATPAWAILVLAGAIAGSSSRRRRRGGLPRASN